jgi:hypothetical protein
MKAVCNTGKIRYDDKVAATVAMRHTQQRRKIQHKPGGYEINVYMCPMCGGWHGTKLRQSDVKKKPRAFRPDRLWPERVPVFVPTRNWAEARP